MVSLSIEMCDPECQDAGESTGKGGRGENHRDPENSEHYQVQVTAILPRLESSSWIEQGQIENNSGNTT
jgi:hypothetical protein